MLFTYLLDIVLFSTYSSPLCCNYSQTSIIFQNFPITMHFHDLVILS